MIASFPLHRGGVQKQNYINYCYFVQILMDLTVGRKSDNSEHLQIGQFVLESSLLLQVAIYEYNNFNRPIELLSYALLTANHPANVVLQTLVHSFLPLTQSPALLINNVIFQNQKNAPTSSVLDHFLFFTQNICSRWSKCSDIIF